MAKEKKVKIYDPSVGAYREVSLSKAEKFVESAKEAEEQIKAVKKEKK